MGVGAMGIGVMGVGVMGVGVMGIHPCLCGENILYMILPPRQMVYGSAPHPWDLFKKLSNIPRRKK